MKMNEEEIEALIDVVLEKRKAKKSENGIVTIQYRLELDVGTIFQFVDSNERFIVCKCEKDDWPCENCEFYAMNHKDSKLMIKRRSQCFSFGCDMRRDGKKVFVKKVEE